MSEEQKEKIREKLNRWSKENGHTYTPLGDEEVGGCSGEVADFLVNELVSLLQTIESEIEGEKKTLPKDPLDMTLREQMSEVIQPVYRPWVSNQESFNQGLDSAKAIISKYKEIK